MKRPYPTRTKSITPAFTEEEFLALRPLMGTQAPAAWVRGVCLEQLERRGIHRLILEELMALRTVVVNFEHARAAGETLSFEAATQHIAAADAGKIAKAKALLGIA